VTTAISVPVILVYFVWGKELVMLVFGEEYASASTALLILCVGQFMNASSGSVALILNMTGNDRKTLQGVGVALISNITISYFLFPIYGFLGVAIGYSVSLIMWNLIMVWMVKKYTGISAWFGGGYGFK
jgi:O-antigen/teichoic acid export membrane protein